MDTHTLASETNAASREIGVSNHVVKVIEVLAESADSWEDAAQMALREASRSLRDIVSIYIKDLQAVVRDGRIAAWRVNAKVSFVVNAESSQTTRDTGGETMRNRHNQDPRWRGENAFPEYEDYGLHAEDRQRYRGRESYEQQSRSGMGGRSGAFNQRLVPRDDTQPYRNNADEDRRGYQNLGYRQEFEGRSRGGYDRDYEDARYGFDARDYGRPRERWEARDYRRGDDYSRTDYGQRGYGQHDYGQPDYQRDYHQQRDFGSPDYPRGFGSRDYGQREDRDAWQRQYGSPYSRSSSYEDPYDSPRQRSGYDLGGRGYGGRSSGNWPEQGFEHQRSGQGQGEFGYGRRQQARGPKGYKRSDDRIREDVCDRLSQSWDLDASEVEVTVSNGEVTLTGTINDRDQKFRAESIADAVGGVNEVHNQLRVRRESTAQTNRETSTQATKPSATNPRSS